MAATAEVLDLPADAEDITFERRRRTLEIAKVDKALLAMARGDIEAAGEQDFVDPFGGLIPVFDDPPPPPPPPPPCAAVYRAVLRLRMPPQELIRLPLDARSGFLLSHFDGKRSVEDVIDLSQLSTTDALEVIDDLLALGAIALV